MAAIPRCPGCDRPAPAPDSAEAGAWQVGVGRTGGPPPIIVCPDCLESPETLQRVEVEAKRADLAFTANPSDAVLFVNGEAKPAELCTPDELRAGQEDMRARLEQVRAWTEWFRAHAALQPGEEED